MVRLAVSATVGVMVSVGVIVGVIDAVGSTAKVAVLVMVRICANGWRYASLLMGAVANAIGVNKVSPINTVATIIRVALPIIPSTRINMLISNCKLLTKSGWAAFRQPPSRNVNR